MPAQTASCWLSVLRLVFNSRTVSVGFVVNIVALRLVFLQYFHFTLPNIIPLMVHTHLLSLAAASGAYLRLQCQGTWCHPSPAIML